MRNVELVIDGMGCGHCVAAVRRALTEVAGAGAVDVHLGAARVTCEEASLPAARLVAAVEAAGYAARVVERAG